MDKKWVVLWLLVILNFVLYAPIYLLHSRWGKQAKTTFVSDYLQIVSVSNTLIDKQLNRVRSCGDVIALHRDPKIQKEFIVDIKTLNKGESAQCVVRYYNDPAVKAEFTGVGK